MLAPYESVTIDKDKFGPWAIVTGASSGIGKEFARALAANSLNLVLVARRLSLLEAVGQSFSKEFGIQYRVVELDLAENGFMQKIDEVTRDLDIGLLISNAGTGRPGRFLDFDESELQWIVRLNATSHLSLTHYFGRRFAKRKRGGILLASAMGAPDGIPYMANEAGTKALITSLGKGLHTEFKEIGVHLTVLITPPTDTPIVPKLGWTKENMPSKPISVEQCVGESLVALNENRMTVLPGRLYRIMNTLVPASFARKMVGKMMKANNGIK